VKKIDEKINESDLPDDYDDLVEFIKLCKIIPTYIMDKDRVLRFKTNSPIRYLLDHHKNTNKDGLNVVWENAYDNDYTVKEMVELYIHIGYSLGGFYEIFGNIIDTILRIRYDSRTGDFIDKLGETEETIKLINSPIGDVK